MKDNKKSQLSSYRELSLSIIKELLKVIDEKTIDCDNTTKASLMFGLIPQLSVTFVNSIIKEGADDFKREQFKSFYDVTLEYFEEKLKCKHIIPNKNSEARH